MPAYHFKALDDQGSVQKGLLEGDSARQVRQQLRDKQWTPVEVSAVNDRQSQNKSHTGSGNFHDKPLVSSRSKRPLIKTKPTRRIHKTPPTRTMAS